MENKVDIQYQTLLQKILDFGIEKKDRTGTGTKSIFGYNLRFTDIEHNFPILTTKKMPFKTIVTELLWFLRGDTNIQYLVQNDCNIWNGDAYKNYTKEVNELIDGYMSGDVIGTQPHIDEMFSNPDDLTPLTKEEFINKIKTDDGFAKTWGDLGPIYGKQWRSWELPNYSIEHVEYGFDNNLHVDQIQNLIKELKINPDSRRLMVSAWNVGELDQMVLPPCHYGFQVWTRELTYSERYKIWFNNNYETGMEYYEGNVPNFDDTYYEPTPTRAISLMWNQRSVDTFLGLPFNITSYALLLRIIAKEVNMKADELIANLGDTHLYSNHIEQAKEQISRDTFQLPRLKISEHVKRAEGDCLPMYKLDDFTLENYQSHPIIKAPLSN